MKKIKFKVYKKKSGSLIPFSLKKNFPIKVKRIFIINGNKNFIRGDHAHKKCSQFLFPILGKIKVEHVSKDKAGSVLLDFSKKEGILLKPKTWCKIKFLTKNAILLVACDMEYQFSDYIESYQEFLKIIKKRKIK
jgi:dTDP-4-dehydrorhamnose 3,5-epimerase-like enzyme|tara:strand:+ start:569 stop:973 length:405 start_codon:yes stop_codon:yes gene_type:complete